MIPYYNTDLSGESNLNRAKRRVISQMSRAYATYPASFMSESDLKYSRRMDTTIAGILNQIESIGSSFDTIIDSIDFDGYNSSYKSSAEYIEDLSYLRTLVDESIPKLNRYFDFIYKNLSNLTLADFLTIKKALEDLADRYFALKHVSIRDPSAPNLQALFRFVDDERKGGDDMSGGAGGRPRGRPRKEEPKPGVDIASYFTARPSLPPGIPSIPDVAETKGETENIRQEIREVEGDTRVRPDQRRFLRPFTTTRLAIRPKEEGDIFIEREVLWRYWSKLIEAMEGVAGIFTKWLAITASFNESRPSLKPSSKMSDRVGVDEETGEMVGGRYYDASRPYIPPMYV